MTEIPGQIPQSTALAEASTDSLAELLSRDPEGYQRQDLTSIITALREQRVKWQASEAASRDKPRRAGSSAKAELSASTSKTEGDLGL